MEKDRQKDKEGEIKGYRGRQRRTKKEREKDREGQRKRERQQKTVKDRKVVPKNHQKCKKYLTKMSRPVSVNLEAFSRAWITLFWSLILVPTLEFFKSDIAPGSSAIFTINIFDVYTHYTANKWYENRTGGSRIGTQDP